MSIRVQAWSPSDEDIVEILMAGGAIIHTGLRNTGTHRKKRSDSEGLSKRCHLHRWTGYSTAVVAV